MRRIVVFSILFTFILLVSGLNFSFADENEMTKVKKLEEKLEGAFKGSLSYKKTDKALDAIKELSDIGTPEAARVLIKGVKWLWEGETGENRMYSPKLQDKIYKGIRDTLVKLDKENPKKVDKFIPTMTDLFKNSKSVKGFDSPFEDLKGYPISLIGLDVLVELAEENPNRRKKIKKIFLDALKNGSNHMKRYAAWAAGVLKISKSVPYLIKASRKENFWMTRKNAVSALGEIASSKEKVYSKVTDVLADVVKSGENIYVQTSAVKALWKIGKAKPSEVDKVVSALTNVLKDDRKGFRQASIAENAFQALKEIGRPAIPYLEEEFKKSKDQATRKRIVRAFAYMEDRKSISPLTYIAENKSENPNVRKMAIQALGRMTEQSKDVAQEIVPVLTGLLEEYESLPSNMPTSLGYSGDLSEVGSEAAGKLIYIAEQYADENSFVIEPLQELAESGNDKEKKMSMKILEVLEEETQSSVPEDSRNRKKSQEQQDKATGDQSSTPFSFPQQKGEPTFKGGSNPGLLL